jgi:hypothetical protein
MFDTLFYWTGAIMWAGFVLFFVLAITVDIIDQWGWK